MIKYLLRGTYMIKFGTDGWRAILDDDFTQENVERVALAMGKKMEKIAKSAQVLAITHLPQVAAMSDYHYYIYKTSDSNKSQTIVKPLNTSEKELEVARLLSGDNITDSFIVAAKELISSK